MHTQCSTRVSAHRCLVHSLTARHSSLQDVIEYLDSNNSIDCDGQRTTTHNAPTPDIPPGHFPSRTFPSNPYHKPNPNSNANTNPTNPTPNPNPCRQCFFLAGWPRKTPHTENRRSAAASAAGKWRRETQCHCMACAAGKPSVAYVCGKRQYCVPSENRHRHVATRDLDVRPFDPKIKGFPGLIVKLLYVNSSDPSCVVFWDIVRINRQTDRQTQVKTLARDCRRSGLTTASAAARPANCSRHKDIRPTPATNRLSVCLCSSFKALIRLGLQQLRVCVYNTHNEKARIQAVTLQL